MTVDEAMLPNLIIAGAPKCGSTSLFEYLADHPNVLATAAQESRYLIEPGHPLFNSDANFSKGGLTGYAALFATQPDAAAYSVRMDCTPDYLYEAQALEVIATLPSKPIVVFILREPARRIYSLYSFAQNNIGTVAADMNFDGFIAAVRAGQFDGKRPLLAQAFEHSDYASYLQPWFERIPPEQRCVILFEDLVKLPRQALAPLLSQLGLNQQFYDDYAFGHRNQTFVVNQRGFYQLIRRTKQWAGTLKRIPWLYQLLHRWYFKSVVSAQKPAMSAADQQAIANLTEEFAVQNAALETLLERPLTAWQGERRD